MRRLLILAALALPLPAAAQPWAPDAARTAGRMAIATAGSGRWAESESYAAAADPLAAKIALWMRLSNRAAPASAADLVAFIAENPDWPLPDAMNRKAEAALSVEGDDALALRHFARNPARTLQGTLRHAEALDRAGRAAEVQAVIRRGWAETPSDPLTEETLLLRFGGQLTAADHWARFDRLAFARDMGGASRAAARLTGAQANAAAMRLALAQDNDSVVSATPTDIGWAYEQARLLRRRDRDTEAAAAWVAAERLQTGLSDTAARAIWVERQVLSRKLLRLGQTREAYRTAAAHGQAEPGESRQDAEFLAGFIALRRLNDPATAQRHFVTVGDGSRSVITRARAAYWQGRALAAAGDAAGARARYAEGAALPVAFYGQLSALALGETPAQLSARIMRAPTPATTQARAVDFTGRELTRAVLTLADLGDTRRARIFLLRIEDLAADGTDRMLAARLATHIGRPDHAVWVARRAGADGDIILPDGWPRPYQPPGFEPGAGLYPRHHPAGEQFRHRGGLRRQCARADATAALDRDAGRAAARRAVPGRAAHRRPDDEHAARRGVSGPDAGPVRRGAAARGGRLQCGAGARGPVARHLWRPARRRCRHDRLDGTDPLLRDAQLCPAG
jgi:soluble lytic murein transglycosylase